MVFDGFRTFGMCSNDASQIGLAMRFAPFGNVSKTSWARTIKQSSIR